MAAMQDLLRRSLPVDIDYRFIPGSDLWPAHVCKASAFGRGERLACELQGTIPGGLPLGGEQGVRVAFLYGFWTKSRTPQRSVVTGVAAARNVGFAQLRAVG
jgi:hypothetical protein